MKKIFKGYPVISGNDYCGDNDYQILRNGKKEFDLIEFLDDNLYYGTKYNVTIEIVEEK